jgi:hypothetical protein
MLPRGGGWQAKPAASSGNPLFRGQPGGGDGGLHTLAEHHGLLGPRKPVVETGNAGTFRGIK